MAEQVSDFMVRLLGHMIHDNISSFEVKESAERNWADFCKQNIGNTPYRGACISYYKVSDRRQSFYLSGSNLFASLSVLLGPRRGRGQAG
jgi:hypothetical protein